MENKRLIAFRSIGDQTDCLERRSGASSMKVSVGVAVLSLLMTGTAAIGVSPALAQTPIDVQMTAPAQGSTLRRVRW